MKGFLQVSLCAECFFFFLSFDNTVSCNHVTVSESTHALTKNETLSDLEIFLMAFDTQFSCHLLLREVCILRCSIGPYFNLNDLLRGTISH